MLFSKASFSNTIRVSYILDFDDAKLLFRGSVSQHIDILIEE